MSYILHKKYIITFFLIFSIFLLFGCSDTDKDTNSSNDNINSANKNIILDVKNEYISMEKGEYAIISYKVKNNDSDYTVIFKSSDNSIASIDESGLIYGNNIGDATISVSILNTNITKLIPVKIDPATLKNIKIVPNSINIYQGSKQALNIQTNESNSITNIDWISNNENIATVDNNGVVYGKSIGETNIKASIKGTNISTIAKVVIKSMPDDYNEVTSLTLKKENLSVTRGEIFQIEPVITPSNATNKQVFLTSSDSNIVSVRYDNKLYAISAGNAIIEVKSADGGFISKCNVTVNPILIEEIKLDVNNISLIVGQDYWINPIIIPFNADNNILSYSSSNNSAIQVSSLGQISAVGEGDSIITISSDNNIKTTMNVKATYTINSNITVSTDNISFADNKSGEKSFTVTKSNIKSQYTIKKDLPEWVKLTSSSNGLIDTYIVQVDENKSAFNRNANINIYDTNGRILLKTIKISQVKNYNPKKRYVWLKGVTPPNEGQLKNEVDVSDTYFRWLEDGFYGWYNVVKRYYANGSFRDSNMCWAMTTANMLHWWAEHNKKYIDKYKEINKDSFNTEKCLMEYDYTKGENEKSTIGNMMRGTFTNDLAGGDVMAALNWFILGRNYGSTPGLGCFQDAIKFDDAIAGQSNIYTKDDFENAINDAVKNGKAIAVSYRDMRTFSAHVVTIWGVVYDEENNIIELYNADSNIGESKLFNFGIYYKDGVPYTINTSANAYSNTRIEVVITLGTGEDAFKRYFQEKGVTVD